VPPDLTFILKDLPSPLTSGSFVEQLKAQKFFQYTEPGPGTAPVSPGLNLTNLLLPR